METQEHVVVPFSWIKLSDHMEGMINNGINASFTFEVYYTQNREAFQNGILDGIPRWEFKPNVDARFDREFPNEGWYHCRLKKFKGK